VAFGAALGDSTDEAIWIAGAALLITAAAGGVGALLGFLFGIPRTLQREGTADEDGPRYLANTNLEQISDWLTKILVGISLVQIGNAGAALSSLSEALGPMLGDEPASPGIGLALCIVASLSGFLLSYLWTRVRLKHELQIADRDIEATVRKVFDERASEDALALSLVERQLTGQDAPTARELVKALGRASEPVLIQAYQVAEGQRTRSWHNPEHVAEHERTIPVFEALIANDPDKEFDQHFGSLGFALKDREHPDLPGAIDALTTAIASRGDKTPAGFRLYYEWNRAACKILSLDEPAAETPRAQRIEIEADLRMAALGMREGMFGPPTAKDPTIRAIAAWLEANHLSYADLRR
jgi:hypothetical protein